MGIAGFQKWLEQQHAKCFFKLPQPPIRPRPGEPVPPVEYFDHIYVDLNGYLHTVGRKRSDDDDFFTGLFFELDKLFKQCVARQSIFLAVDGPASAAKLITQRRRRLAAANKQDRKKDEPPKKNKNKRQRRRKGGFNLLQVTAGTPFMCRLKNAVCFWACSRLQSQPKFHNTRIYISGPDVPGEGELKIIEFMVSHANADSVPPHSYEERMFATQAGFAEQERDAAKFRSDSHLIVGTDADLVLLGMSCMLQNVFVLHSQQGVSKLFSVWEFCRSLERSIPLKGHCNRTRLDFVFISLTQGNDYLPKLFGASITRLWPKYIKMRSQPQYRKQFLVNPGYALNVPFFLALLGFPLRVPLSHGAQASPASPPPATLAPFSPLCHATTQAFGSISLDHQADFVDPAIISTSAGFVPHTEAGDALLLNDPSIIAASLPTMFKHALAHYPQPHYPLPAAGGTMPPALSLIFADPYLSAAAFPSPTAAPVLPPAFGHTNLASRASVQVDDDEEEEVICFRPMSQARGAAVEEEKEVVLDSMDRDLHLPGEDLIEEAINEESEEGKGLAPDPKRRRIAPGEGEENVKDDDEEEDYEDDYSDDDEDEDEDEDEDYEDDEDEESPALKGLKRGSDVEEYLGGLFWCLKMYMEGVCPDNRWFYTHCSGPSGEEFRNYFESMDAVPMFYNVPVPDSSALPLEPHKFCLTVLPLQARDCAHEILQPYMALDSKLGSIFRDPTALVDVRLIESVLSEIPESSLPPELRFSHTHYYQRAPGAPYQGRAGLYFSRGDRFNHQPYRYPEGPSVLSLLPQPVKRLGSLWEPERWIKCAYYHTRSYPLSGLYDPQRHRPVIPWPILLDGTDYLTLPYYMPSCQQYPGGRGAPSRGPAAAAGAPGGGYPRSAGGPGGAPPSQFAPAGGYPGGRGGRGGGGARGGRGGGPHPAAATVTPAPSAQGAPSLRTMLAEEPFGESPTQPPVVGQPGRGRGNNRGSYRGSYRGSDGGSDRGAYRGSARGGKHAPFDNDYFYDNDRGGRGRGRGRRGGQRDSGAAPAAALAPAPATIPESGYRVVFRPKTKPPAPSAAANGAPPPSQ